MYLGNEALNAEGAGALKGNFRGVRRDDFSGLRVNRDDHAAKRRANERFFKLCFRALKVRLGGFYLRGFLRAGATSPRYPSSVARGSIVDGVASESRAAAEARNTDTSVRPLCAFKMSS